MKTDYQLEVINRIRNLRFDNKLSQAGFSEIINVSYGLIGNIESTRFGQKYTLKQIQTACKYFGFPIQNIFLEEKDLKLSKDKIIEKLIQKIIEYGE